MRVLASRLRALRLRRGDQRRLAELAGVSSNTLIKWRKGLGNPRLSELEALADAMGVSVVYLVNPESAEQPRLFDAGDEANQQRVERLLRRAEKVARELTEAVEHQKRREPGP